MSTINVTAVLKQQQNIYHSADIAWVMTSSTLVWLMIPGVGFFYSGMARKKNALSLIMLSILSVSIVSVQWLIIGYSLAFGKGGPYIGNLDHAFYRNMDSILRDRPIPDMTFAIFEGMFAAITPALAIGSAAERGRILPAMVFIFIWTTIVWDPIAHWTWSPDGWSAKLGGLDFAGGTPVHISSGTAALAYCIILKRRNKKKNEEFKAHNITHIILGTTMLWFGWFGFNGGSAFAANQQAVNALLVTNISASIAGLTWMALDYRINKKLSAVAFCCGVVAGLVCITPAAGYVTPASSILFGVLGGLMCNLATQLKEKLDFDDALDVFAVHGVGGIVGNILTGVFAKKSIVELSDFETIDGGAVDGNWKQIAYQAANSAAGLAYSFAMTSIILLIMNWIPLLALRTDPESEKVGLDCAEMGESAYQFIEELVITTGRRHDQENSFLNTEINHVEIAEPIRAL